MKQITPQKQHFSHSCLVSCLLMLRKEPFSKEDEKDILIKGMERSYPFYVTGIPQEFSKKFNIKLNIIVDNAFFTNELKKSFNNNITVQHNKITLNLIKELLKHQPIICHIDDNYIGDYSHASHFIILEKATEEYIQIIDPLTGKRSNLSNKKLEASIKSLKDHIKMCPLLFY